MSSGYVHPEVTSVEIAWLVFEARSGVTLLVLHGCLPAAVQPRVSGAFCFSMATMCVLCVMLRCKQSPFFVLWSWFTGFGLLWPRS